MTPNKEPYTVENLLQDPDFAAYCEQPTAELSDYWNNWLQAHSGYREIFEEAKQLYLLAKQENTWAIPEGAKERTLARIQLEIQAPRIQKRLHGEKIRFLKYAAVALILLSIGFWILNQHRIRKTPAFLDVQRTEEIRRLVLPDGTLVTLNKGGGMAYSEEKGVRRLRLTGEAYIQVTKQEQQPFIVEMDKMSVQVLGTEFNAKNDPEQKNIVLIAGKVKVLHAHEAIEMLPGEKILLKKDKMLKEKVKASMYTAWLNGNLVLDNTPLVEIVEWLEDARGFQVENYLNPADQQKKLSGNLNLEQDETLFKTLESVFNIRIIKNQQKLLIKSVTN